MERVHTLIEKLQQQLAENVAADKLLVTVQMLQSELMQQKGASTDTNKGKVAILMPGQTYNNILLQNDTTQTEQHIPESEKIVEVLKVDEKEIEQELEDIKRNAG